MKCMKLFQCPSCGTIFVISINENDVYEVECPNINCKARWCVYDKKIGMSDDLTLQGLFQELKSRIIPKMGKLKDAELNIVINHLSTEYKVGNVLVCEMINALLNSVVEETIEKKEQMYFVNIEQDTLSIKELFDKLELGMRSDTFFEPKDNIALQIANQHICSLKEEKSDLLKQIERMKKDNFELKRQIDRYR